MANQTNNLSHTKWMCKYHIVFTPKYRRKIIYNQYRESLREVIKLLCKYKGVEILEGHLMPDYVHLVLNISPKLNSILLPKSVGSQIYILGSRVFQTLLTRSCLLGPREARHTQI